MDNLIKEKVFFTIEQYSFERFINKSYPHLDYDFDISQDEELNRGSYQVYKVKKGSFDQNETELFNDFLNNEGSLYIFPLILKDLVNQGLIKEGDYLLSIPV